MSADKSEQPNFSIRVSKATSDDGAVPAIPQASVSVAGLAELHKRVIARECICDVAAQAFARARELGLNGKHSWLCPIHRA